MNIQNKIKEIEGYFKSKILSGDYKITGTNGSRVFIIIDNTYKFSLWVDNIPKNNFKVYGEELSKELINITLDSDEERLRGYSHIEKYVLEYKSNLAKLDKFKLDLFKSCS